MNEDNKRNPHFDYNYPALCRKDLMSLSTISKNDFPMRNIKNRITSTRDWSLNLFNLDIEKAIPNRQSIYTHKIDYINKVDDIDKARPIKITMTRPTYSLMNRDIDKAYPKKQYRFTRQTNPLEPVYDFPKVVEPGPFEVPKFIRNTLDISDIDKARPRKSLMFAPEIKTYDNYIEKSQPKKPYVRKVFHDNFYYSDVYQKQSRFNRQTNPICPDYGRYGGDIHKSHPMYSYDPYRLPGNLSCDDIRGTQPGTKNKSNLINTRHLAYSCEDIIGACQGSYKRGITSNRVTNPLNPEYQYLGNKEIAPEPSRFVNKFPKLHNVKRSHSSANEISSNHFAIINNRNDNNKTIDKEEGNNEEVKRVQNENERYTKIGNNQRTNERYEKAKEVNWSELPYYEEKPIFESELYKRPDPYYPFRHHRELILTKTKPHNMALRYKMEYGNNSNNANTSYHHLKENEEKENNELNEPTKKLDNPLINPPTYEEQLTSFIKESTYHH